MVAVTGQGGADTATMRYSTTAGSFGHAVAVCEPAVRSSGQFGIQIDAQPDGITVIGTDGEITTTATVDGAVSEPGTAVCVAKPVASYCATLDPVTKLEVHTDGGYLVVRGGGRVYRFALLAERYPAVERAGSEAVLVPAGAISQLLTAVRHAVDPRTGLVKLTAGDGMLRLYATDTYRLAMAAVPVSDGSWSVLLPVHGLLAAMRHQPEHIAVDPKGRVATFTGVAVETTVRLGVAAFPAVEGAIGVGGTTTIELDRTGVERALQRLASVAASEPLRVELDSAHGVRITALSSDGTGVETVPATVVEPVTFGVAGRSLLDALHACGGTAVAVSYTDARRPVQVASVGAEPAVICILMPIVLPG